MKEICVGICLKDDRYGRKLMEYLNHQKEFPMTACYFGNEESLWVKEQEGMFQCLLLSDESNYQGYVPFCRIDSRQCQSAAEIAGDIYDQLQVRTRNDWQIYGIYSPFGGMMATEFALEFVKRRSMPYLGMQPYPIFSVGEETTDELLFHIRQRRDDCIEYFLNHQEDLGSVKGYPGAGCFLDYRELSEEDYQWFFECIREKGISLAVDIGTACVPGLGFFRRLDKIYLPVTEQELETELYAGFLKQMRKYGIWGCSGMEEIVIGGKESIKEVISRL